MAPEMCDAPSLLSRATDVYLLGAILHELICGRPPHRGASLINVLSAAARNDVLPLEPRAPASPQLLELTERCLASDPGARFADAGELREAFARFRSGAAAREESRAQVELARAALAEAAAASERAAFLAEEGPAHLTPDEQRERPDPYAPLFRAEGLLQGALRRWPENAAAQELLDQTARALIEAALAAQDLRLAEAVVGRVPSEEQPALRERLRRLEVELDPQLAVTLDAIRRRTALLGAAAVVVYGLVALLSWVLIADSRRPPPSSWSVPICCGLLLIPALAQMLFGRSLARGKPGLFRLVRGAVYAQEVLWALISVTWLVFSLIKVPAAALTTIILSAPWQVARKLRLQLDGLREHLVRDPLTTPGEDAARATLDDWPSS